MPIDQVAVSRARLALANAGGSLSHESDLRAEIEKFQQGIAEQRPSVIDISSSAERTFDADMANLTALAHETIDPQLQRFLLRAVRSFQFLARTKGDS